MNVPLNFSTPIKAGACRRSNIMPWLCASSPIKKFSRPTDTTALPVSSAGVLSIEFEIVSSDEEFIIPNQSQMKKSSRNKKKIAAKSEKSRDHDLNIETNNDEVVSGMTLPKRKKLESAVMKQTSTTKNLFKKTASTRQKESESSDSETIITGKPTAHKTERTTLMTGIGRKKLVPAKGQSDTPSKDKKKTSTTASPLHGSSVKKIPDSPLGNIPAVVPLRKSSVRIQSKTVSVTENGSSRAKTRAQLGSATNPLEVVKRKIDFEGVEMEERILLRSSVLEDVVRLQYKSVRLSVDSNKRSNLMGPSSPTRITGRLQTGKSLQSTQSNELDGRLPKRKRVPTSAFWLGQALHENNIGTKSTKVQAEHNIDNKVTKKKPHLKKNVKAPSNLKKKTTKGVGAKKKRNSNEQTVCLAAFNEAQFDPHGEGDTNGVLRATGMFLNDMESQFIQLPPREETGDLCSYLYNQLYTVLENQVSLEIDGILQDISLHGQFHVCKGVLHRVMNKTNKKSLMQRIIIHK